MAPASSREFVIQANYRVWIHYETGTWHDKNIQLNTSPKRFLFLKTSKFEFLCVEVWLTDQNSEPSRIEDKTLINLIIN